MLNNISLMGRLTTDPEHKQTPSGVSVTSFTIAVERNFVDKQSGKREVDFINIVAWRGTADLICKFFTKGKLIALQGSITSRNYEDKNGNKRTAIEVVADQVFFTGDKAENKSQSPQTPDFQVPEPYNTGEGYEDIHTSDDDLPY